MEFVRVSHVTVEHGHIAEQRCECGGEYNVERWELVSVDVGMQEAAYARCLDCGKTRDFLFDISRIFERAIDEGEYPLFDRAWPSPFEGPYALRLLPGEFAKRSQEISRAAENGEFTYDEALPRLKELIDCTHPRIAGRYQVFGYRKGSMGFAYLCVDSESGPDSPRPYFVVCKCLAFSQDGVVQIDEITIEALRHETKVWLELGAHSNVVQLLDVLYVSPENTVLVLEAVAPGSNGRITLRDWMESNELVWPLQLRFARDLIRGLLFASNQIAGFVHGDLKPSNLLIDVAAGHRLKITDFGLSRAVGLELPERLSSLGTRMYMAPECWTTKKFTPASDIYACGLVLYEMIAGRHPLCDHADIAEIEQNHRQGISIRDLNTPGSEPLVRLIRRCLSVDPPSRPSIAEIATELQVTADEPQRDQDCWQALELNKALLKTSIDSKAF